MKYAIGKPSQPVARYFETGRHEDLETNLLDGEVAVEVSVIDASQAFCISADGTSVVPASAV